MVQRASIAPVQPATLYDQLQHSLKHDTRWTHEISLGKRVGFYRFSGDIGSGNFSQVKLAVHQLTKDKVAIKIIDKSKLDNKTRKMLAREIATMEAVHHPNVIRLFEVVETYTKIHLVTEYAKGGELFNKISSEGKINDIEAKTVFCQVALAVHYMHSKGFIHRDIKAENVFYAGPSYVKLGDFGFSTKLIKGPDEHLNTFCGSPPYAAPELFRDQHYIGRLVDTWALGVLLYFMVTGAMPFRANTVVKLKDCILNGKYDIPSYVSNACARIIECMLQQLPTNRASLEHILKSDWLNSVDTSLYTVPYQKFVVEPTNTEDINGINAVETKARKKLETYGITAEMLGENVQLNSKSAVIGIYRIIVHRFQQALFEANKERKESLAKAGQSKHARKNSGLRNKMSTTCVIL